MSDYPEPRFCAYVGMPKALYLQSFAEYVKSIFEDDVYLVGSALQTKSWKDLDIVVVISDKKWEGYGFGDPQKRFGNKKWAALCMSISCFGKHLIGCEIDFQIHQKSYVDEVYQNNPRIKI